MKPDFYYEIALSSLPQIGAKTIQTLFEYFDSAEEILKANAKAFENIPKIIVGNKVESNRSFITGSQGNIHKL
jgi:excinuclease UvrABC nuclease subunit